MSYKGLFLVALSMGMLGSECGKDETRVSVHRDGADNVRHDHAQSSTSAPNDVVHLTEASRDLAGIEVEDVKTRECRCVLKAMGKVLAPRPQTAIVGHAFSARVAEIHVKIGDWVEKSQALVTLESQEVGDAKSEFYKTLADRELADLTLAREKRLLESGIGIEKNLLAAETEHKIAQASAEAAEKKLHVLGFSEAEVQEIAETHQISPAITLYAPIDGKVVTHEAVLGALVDQATEILKIIDPTLLWVDAEIYEKDIAKIKIGQKAEIAVPAYPGEIFQGKISYIGDMVNEETRTITVRAEVANEQHWLKPGMFADANIHLNGGEQMLVVPLAAVLEEGNQRFVFVKEKDDLERREVEFGRREVETGAVDGEYWPILKGLKAGEE
ncbi:MAG: efflux RND transporter periplasmic adaptor subunit, partial [Planctomycetes bacterium]|nr:efflux RND transporter periplasmic adaptor subunit [Planctomycetota bacterium]